MVERERERDLAEHTKPQKQSALSRARASSEREREQRESRSPSFALDAEVIFVSCVRTESEFFFLEDDWAAMGPADVAIGVGGALGRALGSGEGLPENTEDAKTEVAAESWSALRTGLVSQTTLAQKEL